MRTYRPSRCHLQLHAFGEPDSLSEFLSPNSSTVANSSASGRSHRRNRIGTAAAAPNFRTSSTPLFASFKRRRGPPGPGPGLPAGASRIAKPKSKGQTKSPSRKVQTSSACLNATRSSAPSRAKSGQVEQSFRGVPLEPRVRARGHQPPADSNTSIHQYPRRHPLRVPRAWNCAAPHDLRALDPGPVTMSRSRCQGQSLPQCQARNSAGRKWWWCWWWMAIGAAVVVAALIVIVILMFLLLRRRSKTTTGEAGRVSRTWIGGQFVRAEDST
jgi:hypothetical protein